MQAIRSFLSQRHLNHVAWNQGYLQIDCLILSNSSMKKGRSDNSLIRFQTK